MQAGNAVLDEQVQLARFLGAPCKARYRESRMEPPKLVPKALTSIMFLSGPMQLFARCRQPANWLGRLNTQGGFQHTQAGLPRRVYATQGMSLFQKLLSRPFFIAPSQAITSVGNNQAPLACVGLLSA